MVLVGGLDFEPACTGTNRPFCLRYKPCRLAKPKVSLSRQARPWNTGSHGVEAHLNQGGLGQVLDKACLEFSIVNGARQKLMNRLSWHGARRESDAVAWHHNAPT